MSRTNKIPKNSLKVAMNAGFLGLGILLFILVISCLNDLHLYSRYFSLIIKYLSRAQTDNQIWCRCFGMNSGCRKSLFID